ncbi:MAG TPA: helix-hairpin-helix domain-containing protein, partial [Gemmatales bacterium]|nr:helix-hairpin-helix domain-containing protein [Gemmatales bacterium]
RKSDNESERYRYLRSSTKELSSDLIDLNQAGLNELQKLPGIGPVLAQRILDDRTKHGLYETVYDLSRIAGIKTKTIEKIMPYVKVEKDKPSS